MVKAKSDRKRARKQWLRARERKAARLGILALIAASASAVGLVATPALAFLRFADGAAWAAAATGVMLLLAATFFGLRARTGLHSLSFLGWTGLTFGGVAGVALTAPVVLLLAGHGEAAALVGGFCLIPVLLAVGCVGAEYSHGAGRTDDMTVANSMSHIDF
ncbi:hypothetical protein [Streptomonospora alba]|uniref:hypothetical protein n=1 Tax=Streptomonospora alba TaxID=183763 RepID=UPI0012ED7969|nr:hypothetical protein [Streptomonospora alba]